MRYQKHRQSLASSTPGSIKASSDDATINYSRGKNWRIREISTKGIIDNASDGSSHSHPRYDAFHPRQEREKRRENVAWPPIAGATDVQLIGHHLFRAFFRSSGCATRLSTQDDRAGDPFHPKRPSKKAAVRLAGLDERIRPTNGPAANRSLSSTAAGYIYTKLQLVMCPWKRMGHILRATRDIQSRLITPVHDTNLPGSGYEHSLRLLRLDRDV